MIRNRLKNINEANVDTKNLRWDSLEIGKELLKVITSEFKFNQMTPVQAASIPLVLKNKDVIVEAKTGSGKTLAFLIPLVESLIRIDKVSKVDAHDVLAIVLTPTRELATQIHQELRKILRNPLLNDGRHLVNQLIVGGSSVATDISKYDKFGANIIVATPGRLGIILQMRDSTLSSCIRKKLKYLIFDEADQLLSFDFEKNLSSILEYLPKQRRTSLFSATQTSQVDELVKSGLRDPIRVNMNRIEHVPNSLTQPLPMPEKLSNYYHVCESYCEKLALLSEIIRTGEYKKILVFISTCSQIDYFSEILKSLLEDRKVPILKLHRRLKSKRKAILKKFKSVKSCVLLVTDILSRGIDVPDIKCVIHLDLPASPESYVHRSGRSGHQTELSGVSLLLIEKHEMDYIEMCKRRQIVLSEMNLNHLTKNLGSIVQSLKEAIRKRAKNDEDYETLGIQTFVSYMRFYSSKLCLRELLFPKLEVAKLADSFGLMRLPRMPELRKNHSSISLELENLLTPPTPRLSEK